MVQLRQVLLRPEYHLWYPGIRPNTWLSAEFVAHAVREQLQHGEPRWEVGARILSDQHFRFRGGRQDQSHLMRRRHGERSVLQPRVR